jgi:hypothetical protein
MIVAALRKSSNPMEINGGKLGGEKQFLSHIRNKG